jgi:hypothetical protein
MNLTAGRISQIHTQGMIRIRAKLKISSWVKWSNYE